MLVREMQFEDLQKVFHLGESVFTSEKSPALYRTWDEYEILERFVSEQEYCLVAEIDKKIVGFVIGTVVQKRKSSWQYGYILWLGVGKKYQTLGVGKKLLTSMIRKFKKEGVKILMVDTAADNEKAIKFFKKNKFENEQSHVYMYRNLSRE